MCHSTPNATFVYETVKEYFLQDDPETVTAGFDYTATNFGLRDRSYESDEKLDAQHGRKTQWKRFEQEVLRLNREDKPEARYKVLFLARHGQGVHNVKEKFYGREEWDRYWAAQDGDSESDWVDAHLTELGIQQALAANTFWKRQMAEQNIPMPQRYYTSPLYRCLETASRTFFNLDLPPDRPFKPVVKELLREVHGVHTCDRRSTCSSLSNAFPAFAFEPGFTEDDELWRAERRESDEEADARAKRLLDDIFAHDGKETMWISFTSHSGVTGALLRVLGHQPFRVETGAVMPVLVRAQRLQKSMMNDSSALPA
ncbi:MAG: hypothetical protein LQ351_007502 [Letrouitia transgressa]|nr:MAG: hypothetical protein LQ351_007502 [Letrouitia transgressa]